MIEEHFTVNAFRLFTVFGPEEAKRVNADFLQPEHLLLAILKRKLGRSFAILELLNINLFNLQLAIERETPYRKGNKIVGELPLSARTKDILDTAINESKNMGDIFAGTEHILLALISETNSIVSVFLKQNGLTSEQVKNLVLNLNDRNSNTKKESHNSAKSKKKKRSALKMFGRNLNEVLSGEDVNPVVGRDKEIKRMIQILSRRTKNSPVLIGEPGVGKTSIVDGLVFAILKEKVPRMLLNKKIIAVDLTALIAGTKYRGQFEERLKDVIAEASSSKDTILFIDEIHTLVGAGNSAGALDAANILKPVLSRGEIQCIGATTLDEYRCHIEKDSALERRFQPIIVEEPSSTETVQILNGIKEKYEIYHHVIYTEQAIEKIVDLSKRYIPERFFPDKAIDILDEAGAMKKTEVDKRPSELLEIEDKITTLTAEKKKMVQMQNYENAACLRDEVNSLKNALDEIKAKWQNPNNSQPAIVTDDDVAKVIALITGVPTDSVSEDDFKRMSCIEEELRKKVVGQDESVKAVVSAIRRSSAGISSPDRPICSFLFLGPTGVGKTLLAKTLAEFLFGSKDALIRIDMSDYMEKHNVARLVGAPPGYVGFENGGFLTEKIRRKPYSVLLLDEIEKAHPDVFNILLQILEEGDLKDSLGHTVNFKNTVIIMTSNAGSRSIVKDNMLGFNPHGRGVMDYADIKANAENEIKNFLTPEFINRIDEITVFSPLEKQHIETILNIELEQLNKRLSRKGLTFELTGEAKNYFIENGYNPSYGARPMRRLLQTEIENSLAEQIISGKFKNGETAFIEVEGSKPVITAKQKV